MINLTKTKKIQLTVAFIVALVIFSIMAVIVTRYYLVFYTSSFNDVSIYSSVLGEQRKLFIRLPKGYQPDKSYPLIIQSDGNFNLNRWDESLSAFAKDNDFEDPIVVGIPNMIWTETRNRDLVPPYARRHVDPAPRPAIETITPLMGQGDLFLAFIETEVLPYLNSQYKINDNKVLSGFSAGASLVLYTMVTKPHLFKGYFAFSPAAWYDDAIVVKETQKNISNTQGPEMFLYLTLGADENDIMKGVFKRLRTVLEEDAPDNLKWGYSYSEGAGHMGNPHISIPKAIEAYHAFRVNSK